MNGQLDSQILTLCLYFLKNGKLGSALYLLEVNARNCATAHKEILLLSYRYHNIVNDEVVKLTPEDKIVFSTRISDALIIFIFEHIKIGNSLEVN